MNSEENSKIGSESFQKLQVLKTLQIELSKLVYSTNFLKYGGFIVAQNMTSGKFGYMYIHKVKILKYSGSFR